MANKGLNLYEFSDRELMHLVKDLTDESEDGYITVADFQKSVKLSSKNPHNNIGVRFAWMKTYGIMENNDAKGWKLTPTGDKIRKMKLSAAQTKIFSALKPEECMEAMLALGGVYNRVSDRPEGIVMRRAWRYKSGARS